MNNAYSFLPASSCRCRHCGWIVAANGVTLDQSVDVAYDEVSPERCTDSACESRMVATADGTPAEAVQS